MLTSAILVLEDGTQFHGKAVGVEGTAVGEVVFNTSMTGYQEILTDPSYSCQIVTLTYPHIGNVGTNEIDNESTKIQVAALVIRDLPLVSSNFRNTLSLSNYLKQHNIVAIADIDTRKLTRLLRDKGTQNGCIIAGNNLDAKLALRKALDFPGLQGVDLVKKVTTMKQYIWTQGTVNKFVHVSSVSVNNLPYHVVVYDYGIKHNIMRMLVDRGCRLTVVPAQTPANIVLTMQPDGVFLANGPGDPAPCHYAISNIKILLTTSIPLFGICLGHQLLALASGAKTIKMKFGHHGSNHPVKDLITNRVMITTQNHGFVVDDNTLPPNIQVTHVTLLDGTCQGLRYINQPVFSFQGHPEASPGPQDATSLFDHFIELICNYHKRRAYYKICKVENA